MLFRSVVNKRPTWPWIMILACFLLFAAVAIMGSTKFLTQKSNVQPAFVEERFKEQLGFLRELAIEYEEEELKVEALKNNPHGTGEPIRIPAKAWLKKLGEIEGRFSDPAIVGARVYTAYSASSRSKIIIKECEAATFSSLFNSPGVEEPVVKQKIVGKQKMVSYENLVLDSKGSTRGYQLVIDLNLLQGIDE